MHMRLKRKSIVTVLARRVLLCNLEGNRKRQETDTLRNTGLSRIGGWSASDVILVLL